MLVLCNGMPRSGSTYQYNLARMIVEMSGAGVAHTYMDIESKGSAADAWSADRFRAWVRDDAFHVVKMHEVHSIVPDAIRGEGLKVLYIHRDIRDVAASVKRVRGRTDEALLERVGTAVSLYYELHALRVTSPDCVLWQRYDVAVADPLAATREIRQFLAVSLDEHATQEIARECSVESAKRRCDDAQGRVVTQFNRLRADDPQAAREWLLQIQRGERIMQDKEFMLPHNHVSRHMGASGQWRNSLSQAELAGLMDRHAGWFAHAGYDV